MEEAVATLEPPVKQKPVSPQGAFVGVPVQFHAAEGVIPGTLQRRSLTEPELWDVRVNPNGATISVVRAAVAFSKTPKVGCWSFVPGWPVR